MLLELGFGGFLRLPYARNRSGQHLSVLNVDVMPIQRLPLAAWW